MDDDKMPADVPVLTDEVPPPAQPSDPLLGQEVMFWNRVWEDDGSNAAAEHTTISHVWWPKMVNLANGKTSVTLWVPGDPLNNWMGCALVSDLGAEWAEAAAAIKPVPPRAAEHPAVNITRLEHARALPVMPSDWSGRAHKPTFEPGSIECFKAEDRTTMAVVLVDGQPHAMPLTKEA